MVWLARRLILVLKTVSTIPAATSLDSRTLLVLHATLRVRALWVSRPAIHWATAAVLLSAIDLLWLRILAWCLTACRLIPNWR